jgi:hypothetical protein
MQAMIVKTLGDKTWEKLKLRQARLDASWTTWIWRKLKPTGGSCRPDGRFAPLRARAVVSAARRMLSRSSTKYFHS